MNKQISVIGGFILLAVSPAQAATVWGQGVTDYYYPVEVSLYLDDSEQLLLYGLGPSLKAWGKRKWVAPNPKLELYGFDADGTWALLDSNDNWKDHPSANGVANALEEFGVSFADTEAAMVKQLNPGQYLLRIRNANRDVGGWIASGATTWDGDYKPGDSGGGAVKSGYWRGHQGSDYNLCLNVSGDGAAITESASECSSPSDDREAFYINYLKVEGSECDEYLTKLDWDGNVPIANNSFKFDVKRSSLPKFPPVTVTVEGTFMDGALTGTASYPVGDNICIGQFTAGPDSPPDPGSGPSPSEPAYSACIIEGICTQLSAANCSASRGIYAGDVSCEDYK